MRLRRRCTTEMVLIAQVFKYSVQVPSVIALAPDFLLTPPAFGAVRRPLEPPPGALRFLLRDPPGAGVPSSSPIFSMIIGFGPPDVWTKKSSPSSFHKSRTGSPSSASAGRLPARFEDRPVAAELSRLASWSSFNNSWTISLGFVTSVKFLFPTTMS